MYSIQDVSKKTGLSAHTLRYYEKEGLISGVERTQGGFRQYTDEDLERLSLERIQVEGVQFHYGRGCEKCNNTGYKGRKALTELMVINQELREMISSNAPANELSARAVQFGMRPLREDGLQAIFNGETTVDAVVRYT